jgi:SAM-dependent methyltransferase
MVATMTSNLRALVDSSAMPNPSGLRVWDLGCGDGSHSASFLELRAAHVLATDLESVPEMVSDVGNAPNFSFRRANFAELLNEFGSPLPIDLVYMSLMTEHISDPRQFFRDLFATLKRSAEAVIVHDNFFQPVGHHDHGMLFLNEESWTVEPLGTPCWSSVSRCAASMSHRAELLSKHPATWSADSESTKNPDNCGECNYFRRSVPWAHLTWQDELRRVFPEPFFQNQLNRLLPSQLKWFVQEAGFEIVNEHRTWITNETPTALQYQFGKENLATFTVTLRLRRS